MAKPITVQVTLQNLASSPRTFSLEPYGEYCELGPRETAHASWEITADGSVELEIAITDDSALVADSSEPLMQLRPRRDAPGGQHWA